MDMYTYLQYWSYDVVLIKVNYKILSMKLSNCLQPKAKFKKPLIHKS